jgi:hypothetical protein
MTISSGGSVVNNIGVIGLSSSSSNNSVLVTGNGSVWDNSSDPIFGPIFGPTIIGFDGANNSMTISSGGSVINNRGVIGYNTSSSNNSVLVTGNGSVWSNNSDLTIGLTGANNTLTIANRATVYARSGVIIGSNGILKGNGTLNASVTNNGLLAPGYPTGKLTINGNVAQSSSGTLQIKVVNSNTYSKLQVNGSVTLAGTLEITPIESSLSYGEKLTFLNSSGPIKGSFNTVQVDEPYCRGRVQIIGDPQAIVTIAPTSYTYLAQNQNQTNVATALDSFIPATSGDELIVSTGLDSLTAAQYPAALNAIMPILYQSLSTIAFNIDNAQNQELIQRLWGVRLAGASEYGGSFSMSGLAENTPMLQDPKSSGDKEVKKDILRPAPDNHWGIFVDGNGIFAQANSANLLSTYNAESGGVTTGLSYRWNKQVSTGLYTGYQGVYSKYSGGSTLVDNQVNFGLFGTYGQENGEGLFIDALAGGAYDNYQMNRTISFGNGENALNRTAMGTPGAGELNTMVATGYDLKKGNFTFGPLSSLQYQYFGTSPFSETGAESLNLTANGWNTSSMIFSLGGHLAYNWQATKTILVIPQLSLSWQHQFLENPYSINSTLDYGRSPSFANTSSAPLRDTLYTGIGVTLEFAKRWDTSFFYNAAAGNQDLMSQNIFWSLGVKF